MPVNILMLIQELELAAANSEFSPGTALEVIARLKTIQKIIQNNTK